MKILYGLVITFFHALLFAQLNAGVNSLSKIVITSNRATCQKDKAIQSQYLFNYQENVVVTFADQSTITAENLEVILDGKNMDKKTPSQPQESPSRNHNFLDKFKKITFSGNVIFTGQNRSARANQAELRLATNQCTLKGNVVIQQKKTTQQEVPIIIESEEATLNLKTQEILLSGSENKPVNTVISLEDYEPLKKMKQKKHRHTREK